MFSLINNSLLSSLSFLLTKQNQTLVSIVFIFFLLISQKPVSTFQSSSLNDISFIQNPALSNPNNNNNNNNNLVSNVGFYHYPKTTSNLVTNLTTSVGKTVHLNCSLYSRDSSVSDLSFIRLRTKPPTKPTDGFSQIKLNPTWLKADVLYDQLGFISGYKTENIIVTRKGIILDLYRDKMKLLTMNNNDKLQVLKINEVDIKDEGKYICREFNSQVDKSFYLNVFYNFYASSDIADQGLDESDKMNFGSANSVSIRENDELLITCTVNSSKPAANISIWILKRHNRRSIDVGSHNEDEYDLNETKKLDTIDSFVVKNKDLTLKTVATAKYVPTRYDNHKLITCVAENYGLNEKWESKRILNVLYGPKCNKYQRTLYNTGINQSIELECHMSEANPPYLDFSWNFLNTQTGTKERMRSTGFISRISWTAKSEKDFGEITCLASNGLDVGECKLQIELGGPPNPPYDCYHKENNKTIIIECKPGFDQGDPEVYFYLLKKKSNGALVEYARKRDSCSFLISNFILEEYINDFYIYSSNKFGNNKEKSTKIMIENKDFLLKNSNKLETVSMNNNKQLTIISGLACFLVFMFFFICCVLMRCKKGNNSIAKTYSNQRNYNNNSFGQNGRNSTHSIHFQDNYKYTSHQSQYNGENGIYHQNKAIYDEKEAYLNGTGSSLSDLEHDPNDIQDLEMSPRSKRKSVEKVKETYDCSRSLIDETTETDSENYLEYNKTKINTEKICDEYEYEEQKYYISNNKPNSNNNTLRSNSKNNNYNPIQKVNIWYGNNNHLNNTADSNDEYSGISVDKPINSQNVNTVKLSEYKSFGLNNLKSNLNTNKNSFENYNEDQNSTISTISHTNNTTTNSTNLNDKSEKNAYEWQKSKLFSNETISLDVDDDKMVGILV